MERVTPNIFKPPGLFVHVRRCAEKLRLVKFLAFATSALYPGCGAHRGIQACPGPCEIRGDSIHGPGFPRKVAPGRPCQSSLSYGCPIKLVSFCYRLASLGLQRSSGARRQPSGDSDPKDSPSPESFLVISFVLCGRRGADRTTHVLQKTKALDRWSPRATEAQWYSIDQIWHI